MELGSPPSSVLVVDDSPVDRMVAGGFVEQAGYVPSFATNGREALDLLAGAPRDLVLTDLRMPEMNGLELVKAMRATHPDVPVVLMTAHGSEETAVQALRAGAAHYVPKANLRSELAKVLQVVFEAAASAREREHVWDLLEGQETRYVLGYESGATRALVGHLQDSLLQMHLCQSSDLIRVATALTEALDNALQHGNLELDSSLREQSFQAYFEEGKRRSQIAPYRDRRVHVTVRLRPGEATFVIRDQGKGFDVDSLPDPRDPENLTRPSGRGILLIRTFMDEVDFNERGNEITMVMRPHAP